VEIIDVEQGEALVELIQEELGVGIQSLFDL